MITTTEEIVVITDKAAREASPYSAIEILARGVTSRLPSAIDNWEAAKGLVKGPPTPASVPMLVELCKDALFMAALGATLNKISKRLEETALKSLSIAGTDVVLQFMKESGLSEFLMKGGIVPPAPAPGQGQQN